MEFGRIITLLRKERGITQRQASQDLGISQALLSHYEKGIRECGLDFVVRVADYYDVSCDYLLGRSAERSGQTLRVDEIPSAESSLDSHYKGSVLPTMNKKLIANSMNILFDKLAESRNKTLITEVSSYLMLAVYRMFRLLYEAGPGNSEALFSITHNRWEGYSSASMQCSEADVKSALSGERTGPDSKIEPVKDASVFAMTSQELSVGYKASAPSLLNLIRLCEKNIRSD